MEENRHIIVETTDWQGITLSVTYGGGYCGKMHLELRSISPERALLPVTNTGYRSHFVDAADIEEAGGPVAFVLAWLDQEAQSREWRRLQVTGQQLTLF